jgi:hypothetical protein
VTWNHRFVVTLPDGHRYAFGFDGLAEWDLSLTQYREVRRQVEEFLASRGLTKDSPGVKVEFESLQYVPATDSWWAGEDAWFPLTPDNALNVPETL